MITCLQVDWQNPDFDDFPRFKNIKALQIVLGPGDVCHPLIHPSIHSFVYHAVTHLSRSDALLQVMILPGFWLHFVVSVGERESIQCNGWSGVRDKDVNEIW